MYKSKRLGKTLLINRAKEERKLFVRHPLLATIIVSLLTFFGIFITGLTSALFNGGIINLYLYTGVCCAFNTIIFFEMTEGFFILSKDMVFKKNIIAGFLMALPFAIYLFIMGRGISPNIIPGKVIGSALIAGFIEEAAFRFIPVLCFKRPCVKKVSDIKIALVSALLFFSFHVPNIFGKSVFVYDLLGALFSFFIGFYFAGIYLKSGWIFPCIVMHVINNILADAFYGNLKVGLISFGFSVILFAFTLSVLKKEVFGEKFANKVNGFFEKIKKNIFHIKKKDKKKKEVFDLSRKIRRKTKRSKK